MKTDSHGPLLITGGSGLLALNWSLAVRSRRLVILGMHTRSSTPSGVRARQLQLESVASLVDVLHELNPAIVVHTAGLASVEQCERDPAQARHVNVTLAENVARACAEAGAQMVHISTDHLFDGRGPCVSEDAPVCPRNVYGATKAEAEERVLEILPGALVVRTNFYGWGPPWRQSFSDHIIHSLRKGQPLNLFHDVYYSPILIEDAVATVHALLDRGTSGIVNVVGDDRVSKHEFGMSVARKFGLPAELIHPASIADMPQLVQRPLDMSLANTKVRQILNRDLGGVESHLQRLHEQEKDGFAREIQSL